MIHPVTPWTATAQSDIQEGKALLQYELSPYILTLYNTGDSLWLTANWPDAGSIAFRLAFGLNSIFENVTTSNVDNGILITAATRLGNYRITITFPAGENAIFRYTTTFQSNLPLLLPFYPRDIVPLTKDGRTENTQGTIHVHQVGGRSGQLFFSMDKPRTGSVFYLQNLTAMSPYCEVCETSLAETVGGSWPEIGFQFPVNMEKPVPPESEFVISDAFVVLSEKIPENDSEVTQQYLNYLAAVYTMIPKPDTKYHNWPKIAKKVLKDLYTNKGCWTQTNGIPYLNAYVGDYATPSEIMVQLAVLLPLQEYLEWEGKEHKLYTDLSEGLSDFYDERVSTIVRWHPALEDELDKSEEQKREMVMDSWYLHHPLLNLSRLALKGDKVSEKLFLDSIEFTIKVAHHFDYDWPVFYKMTTLEVLKAETSPGNGGESDVPGSYAHVMLMAWKLTGAKHYLSEAVKAVSKLSGKAFDIFYQANNTAFTAGALVELYKETKEEKYLELSYCCLAGIFKNTQLWDCNYGNGKYFPNFFSVFPLNDAPYTAAYEELEVYAALHHYLQMAEGVEILPALKILIPEFIKYTVNRLPFYYPAMLPEEMIAEDIKTGEVKKDLWIPLEDIHDGWERSGEVGQEVYGAGLPFGIVPRQYFRVKENGLILFCDYPVTGFRAGKENAILHIIGDSGMRAQIRIVSGPKDVLKNLKVEQKKGPKYAAVLSVKGAAREYVVPADTQIRISW